MTARPRRGDGTGEKPGIPRRAKIMTELSVGYGTMRLVPRLGSGIPLVARVEELRRLRAAFTRAERGEAGAVLLAGDAGVGKTRLLTELAEFAGDRGALVLTGRCLDVREGGLPYLPFAEALAPLATDGDETVAAAVRSRPALARLVPLTQAGPPAGAGHPQAGSEYDLPHRARSEQDLGQLQLFDAVLGVLTEIAGRRPVILVLEDLHWADGSTRNLVSFLVSRLRGQRLLVVASYREEEVYRRHPLRALLVEVVRLPTVTRIELAPLGPDAARAFVEALADGPLSPEVLAGVAERSEGNPFFAEELLASCAEGGADLPAGLAELLLARLERLSPDARRVVRVIAVAADAVKHAALAEVSGLGELELEEALREAVHHHVLVVERGAYTFRHALLQEAVYADLLPGERTRVHAAYAARIRRTPQGRGHDAKLAYHSLQSKDLRVALPALLRAAEEAERLGAPAAALRHIEQALEIWDAVPEAERPPDYDELRLLHEGSCFAGTSGEPERAVAYARSAAQALGPGTHWERAAKTWRRLADALINTEVDLDEAAAAVGRAWELVARTGASKTRAWVLATRAAIQRALDQHEEASWSARTAVSDARAAGSTGAEASALITLGALADNAGRFAEARDHLREAEQKARGVDAFNVELRALCFLALSFEDQGELEPAAEVYERGIRRAEETGLTWSAYGLELRARQVWLRYVSGDWPAELTTRPSRGVSSILAARMNASWVAMAVARGRFTVAAKLLTELRPHWRAEPFTALAACAGAELAYWQGTTPRRSSRSGRSSISSPAWTTTGCSPLSGSVRSASKPPRGRWRAHATVVVTPRPPTSWRRPGNCSRRSGPRPKTVAHGRGNWARRGWPGSRARRPPPAGSTGPPNRSRGRRRLRPSVTAPSTSRRSAAGITPRPCWLRGKTTAPSRSCCGRTRSPNGCGPCPCAPRCANWPS